MAWVGVTFRKLKSGKSVRVKAHMTHKTTSTKHPSKRKRK